MHAERRQVLGQTCRCAGVVVFELTDQGTKTSLAVSGRSRLVERGPKGRANTIDEVLLLGQLGQHVAKPMYGAALTIAVRPQLIDRLDQTGCTVGQGQPGGAQA